MVLSTQKTAQGTFLSGFHALSEPLRLRVLNALANQEFCVCDLCQILDISQSKLSFHLKVLREANLVNTRNEGRWIYYSLNLDQFAVLEAFLASYRRLGPIAVGRRCDP